MSSQSELREKKALEISRDIILLSRNSLLVNFRFLDRAVSRIEPVSDDNISLASDGEHLYFNPWFVLSLYKSEQTALPRSMLHTIFHCVFCHSFIGLETDRARWDLACDIAVESTINGLGSSCVNSSAVRRQIPVIDALSQKVDLLTAEKLYSYFKSEDFSDEELNSMRELFVGDNHGLWYGEFDPDAKFDKNIRLKKIWKDVSKRMQTEIEMMKQDRDSLLIQNLKSLNRSKYNYSDFLRRFGVHGEVLQLSEEEFDNNYYMYGLGLYGNVPLVEPLEYSEQKRIRDFVIAIDTSGSVKGEVVQSFIQHTHDILMQRESFFSKINLHIIQCDCMIREDSVITSKEDFAAYIETLELKGFTQTDFRPVFSYVDSLIEKHVLNNLQGLIYFTDGLGTFPSQRPLYDTAFVIHRGDLNDPVIPPWAQYITITEEDILDKRFSS